MIVCKAKNVAHVLVVMFSITVKLGKLLFVMVVYVLIFSSIGSHLLMPFYHFRNDTNQYPKMTARYVRVDTVVHMLAIPLPIVSTL